MSLNDRLAAFFKAHPHEIIHMRTLAEIAGIGGWRNRITDLRLIHHMDIKQDFIKELHNGRWRRASVYRYIPPADTQPSAPQGHDLNVPWSLR